MSNDKKNSNEKEMREVSEKNKQIAADIFKKIALNSDKLEDIIEIMCVLLFGIDKLAKLKEVDGFVNDIFCYFKEMKNEPKDKNNE